MFFIHIPKSAGTYISTALGCQKTHAPVQSQYIPPYIICLRNPFSTYVSFYFFLQQKKNSFQLQRLAKRMTLNQFIQTIVSPELLHREQPRLNPLFNIQGDYGLYTHFLMHLANPNKHMNINQVLSTIQETFQIIRFTHIEEDLLSFYPELTLPRNKINTSAWSSEELLTDETIQLVLEKDKQVINRFFPAWKKNINQKLF